jgi:hypothetical protein
MDDDKDGKKNGSGHQRPLASPSATSPTVHLVCQDSVMVCVLSEDSPVSTPPKSSVNKRMRCLVTASAHPTAVSASCLFVSLIRVFA